jgi:hypothetical protein
MYRVERLKTLGVRDEGIANLFNGLSRYSSYTHAT